MVELPVPLDIVPWLGPSGAFLQCIQRREFQRWPHTEKPDVLLVQHDELARSLQADRGPLGRLPLVSCSVRPVAGGTFPFPRNYERPAAVGSTAV